MVFLGETRCQMTISSCQETCISSIHLSDNPVLEFQEEEYSFCQKIGVFGCRSVNVVLSPLRLLKIGRLKSTPLRSDTIKPTPMRKEWNLELLLSIYCGNYSSSKLS